MSKRPNAEIFLVNTMLNTGADPASYGITEEMIPGYQSHFRWLRTYPTQYGHTPSVQAFKQQFPEFPVDEGPQDLLYAVELVMREHRRRKAIQHLTKASEALRDNEVDEAISMMRSVDQYSVTAQRHENALEDENFLDCYTEKVDSLSTPWKSLNELTGGIRSGDLWYLAARLGNGKSWYLHKWATEALLEGRKVKIYSLEMPYHQVLVRMHVLLGAALDFDVDHISMRDRVYDPVAYKRLVKKIKSEVMGSLYIQDTSRGRISPYTVAQDKDMDAVFIDYAGLMDDPDGGRAIRDWRNMAAISNALKEVSVSQGMRIIAAAQINREGDNPGKYPPKVKNLSQSDALGQDGDVVLTQKKISKSVVVHSVDKNRHGEEGMFYTRFLPNSGKIYEIGKDAADDLYDQESSE